MYWRRNKYSDLGGNTEAKAEYNAKKQFISLENQNFISISQKLLYLWMVECERRRKHTRTTPFVSVVLLII